MGYIWNHFILNRDFKIKIVMLILKNPICSDFNFKIVLHHKITKIIEQTPSCNVLAWSQQFWHDFTSTASDHLDISYAAVVERLLSNAELLLIHVVNKLTDSTFKKLLLLKMIM